MYSIAVFMNWLIAHIAAMDPGKIATPGTSSLAKQCSTPSPTRPPDSPALS